jgi:hypothetical protein
MLSDVGPRRLGQGALCGTSLPTRVPLNPKPCWLGRVIRSPAGGCPSAWLWGFSASARSSNRGSRIPRRVRAGCNASSDGVVLVSSGCEGTPRCMRCGIQAEVEKPGEGTDEGRGAGSRRGWNPALQAGGGSSGPRPFLRYPSATALEGRVPPRPERRIATATRRDESPRRVQPVSSLPPVPLGTGPGRPHSRGCLKTPSGSLVLRQSLRRGRKGESVHSNTPRRKSSPGPARTVPSTDTPVPFSKGLEGRVPPRPSAPGMGTSERCGEWNDPVQPGSGRQGEGD